jgi:uncharacterized protein (TIGR02452 family)
MTNSLKPLPCLDSPALAHQRKRELQIGVPRAASLGMSAVMAAKRGYYINPAKERADLSQAIESSCASKMSVPPGATLPEVTPTAHTETLVQVTNETTLGAARRLHETGLKPLALNFANGINPGGGFLHGARAQEEVLCRSSALYSTLVGDGMYEEHRQRIHPDSTDRAIYSPAVPVYRTDEGQNLDAPWLLSFITCAAPYAPTVGQPKSGDLLQKRIHRILEVARAYGYTDLVLGAWGCGAFGNDAGRTAKDFRQALEGEFRGAFSQIVFAITDWSGERRFLGPFRDVFA